MVGHLQIVRQKDMMNYAHIIMLEIIIIRLKTQLDDLEKKVYEAQKVICKK